MARPLRVEFEDAIYHLCARGNARSSIFRDEQDCVLFVELLSESAQCFEAAILCFVLMALRKSPLRLMSELTRRFGEGALTPLFACYFCTSLFKCRTACDIAFAFVFPNPRTKPRRGVVPK